MVQSLSILLILSQTMTAPRKSKENPPIWVSWGSSHQPSSYGFPWATQQLANLGTAGQHPAPSCSRFRSTAKAPFEKSKIWRHRSVSHWTHQPRREANTSAESKNRPQSMFQHDRNINRCQHPRKTRNPKRSIKSLATCILLHLSLVLHVSPFFVSVVSVEKKTQICTIASTPMQPSNFCAWIIWIQGNLVHPVTNALRKCS